MVYELKFPQKLILSREISISHIVESAENQIYSTDMPSINIYQTENQCVGINQTRSWQVVQNLPHQFTGREMVK
jgi:hypothetical protein